MNTQVFFLSGVEFRKNGSVCILLFLIFLFVKPIAGYTAELTDKGEYNQKIHNLRLLLDSITVVSKEMEAVQKILQGPEGIGREEALRAQIFELSKKRKEMEGTFNQLSAGADFSMFQTEKKTEIDWNQEIKDLLGPVIREAKKITARPREIERLKNKIELCESQLEVVNTALANLDALISESKDPELNVKLSAARSAWENRGNEVRAQLNISRMQLEENIGQKKPFSQSSREFIEMFFKSRGRNLFTALFAFIFTWFILYFIRSLVIRHTSFFDWEGKFFSRLLNILYFVFMVVASFGAVLVILYYYGDWFLLSIAVIFLFGIGWASKHTIPIFWNQAKLFLNMGPVREGEIIVYRGLPYEIVSINFFSKLRNRDLQGGNIRLPLKDLLEFRSRPMQENESWFPSKPDDWVVLNNGTHGKVVIQTPEAVKLELLGGSLVTYRSIDYMALSPMNLSHGFRLWITIGMDPVHQSDINQQIPELFEKKIDETIAAGEYGECLKKISVHFKGVSSFSLDIEIMADFDGKAGAGYPILQRDIPRMCVDVCNLQGWKLSFQQIKVFMHQAI